MDIQYVYLGISLASCFCAMTDFYIIECSNVVGLMCLLDFYFVKKKDIMLHHGFVLSMLHYMNTHEFDDKHNMVSILLHTEISTIFLIIHNLYTSINLINYINKMLFVSTFFYYRIYQYYYLLFNPRFNITLYIHSTTFELCEIYIGMYGLFLLNVYWYYKIINKILHCIKQ
jgi:hypothetical protein